MAPVLQKHSRLAFGRFAVDLYSKLVDNTFMYRSTTMAMSGPICDAQQQLMPCTC